ncbi:MAG TPA: cupin domain-containing protein [Gaiellaceae bacterium]
MSVERVNILGVELDAHLDEAGFRHSATPVGRRLGARRIGAGLYEAEAGLPIWPYHYHYGVEEWLYVIAGQPVLRGPAGERILTPGDLVCFPSGPVGAHTLKGPGRFVIFSTGHDVEPYMSVYPDSDKASGPEGMLLRSSAVGYWHGEGTAGPSGAVEVAREPEWSPPQPAVNVRTLAETAKLGPLLGADRLDGTVVHLDPGDGSEPYHYVYGREEWVLVLAGTLTLRHPQGDDQLEAGDLVCLPEGPAGAHELLNRGESLARALCLSTTGLPANVYYPDTGHWLIRNGLGRDEVVVCEQGSR